MNSTWWLLFQLHLLTLNKSKDACATNWALIYLAHSDFLWNGKLCVFELLLSEFDVLPLLEHCHMSQHANLQSSDLNLSRGYAGISVKAVQKLKRKFCNISYKYFTQEAAHVEI